VSLGLIVGVILSALLTRVLAGQLVGVSTHDPLTFAAVVLTLAIVALAASLVPAGRAASIDPTRALHMN
jgi:putative ABC transport system permease protein